MGGAATAEPMHIADNAGNSKRRQPHARIDIWPKTLFCRIPHRLGRLDQLTFHFESMAHLAAEQISDAIEKINGSMVVFDHIVLLRALDATKHGSGALRVFSSLPHKGGSQQ